MPTFFITISVRQITYPRLKSSILRRRKSQDSNQRLPSNQKYNARPSEGMGVLPHRSPSLFPLLFNQSSLTKILFSQCKGNVSYRRDKGENYTGSHYAGGDRYPWRGEDGLRFYCKHNKCIDCKDIVGIGSRIANVFRK
jgi:hypothetical protein